MDTISITYTSYAVPTGNLQIGKEYQFGKDDKGYFYTDNKNKVYEDLIVIKSLFSPIKKSWEEVLKFETKNYIKK